MPAATLVVVLGVGIAQPGPLADAVQRATAPRQAQPSPAWPPWDPAWPPLPPSRLTPPRPMTDVRGAYAFAVRHADLLQYIPCYCGCGGVGHRSNVNCYVKASSTEASPRWDLHGYS